jgi:DHA2 family multidrug resistance protein
VRFLTHFSTTLNTTLKSVDCFRVTLRFLRLPSHRTRSYVGVPPNLSNEASALINLMRNLRGSVGVSLVTTMLAERTQFNHARLAEHITAYNGFG